MFFLHFKTTLLILLGILLLSLSVTFCLCNTSFLIAASSIRYKLVFARSVSFGVHAFILRKVVMKCFWTLFVWFYLFIVMLCPDISHLYHNSVMSLWKSKHIMPQSQISISCICFEVRNLPSILLVGASLCALHISSSQWFWGVHFRSWSGSVLASFFVRTPP